MAEIAGRGLQSVKQKAGGFVRNGLGEKQPHDLHESDLNGVGVLENGHEVGRVLALLADEVIL